MNTRYSALAISTLISVCAVPDVSAFAQTNTAAFGQERDARLSSKTVAREYVAVPGAPDDRQADTVLANITLPDSYRSLLAKMLSRSATFRRQCARIAAAPHLTIVIRAETPLGTRSAAITRIRREPDGQVLATVQIAPGERFAEMIAHEFEHILEQLDGVDLAIKSRLPSSGVRRVADLDAYETRRAIVTGLRVARESALPRR